MWEELNRRRPDDAHAWAMAHRKVGDRPLQHLPAPADIARDLHPVVAVQKSAQVGLTELLVSQALWVADSAYANRGNALFVMPTQGQMEDFAQARFDRAIQDSPYLRRRLQPDPPRRKRTDSRRLKRLGSGYIYLRGSDSPRQIASVDADLVVLDEYDQMAEGTLELARRRVASSRAGLLRVASTPRYPEAGINALFLQSDQRRYYLPCPGCGLEQKLAWEDNVDIDRGAIVCRECRASMNVVAPGRWIPEAPGNENIHGYHLGRLYSPWANIPAMIEASSSSSAAGLQEFHNSDLGEVFSPPGGGLGIDDLDRCRREYRLNEYAGESCVMGIDVGTKLHVVIREDFCDIDDGPPGRLWFAGEVGEFEDLDALWEKFHVERCVIDGQPETRKAVEFAGRHDRSVWLARYRHSRIGYEQVVEEGTDICIANRAQAIDETFEGFRSGSAELPSDARQLGGFVKDGFGDYFRQVRNLQRTLVQDGHGNWESKWVNNSRPDHYAHAEVYCMLAGHMNAVKWGVA